jgi:hypothetical protein
MKVKKLFVSIFLFSKLLKCLKYGSITLNCAMLDAQMLDFLPRLYTLRCDVLSVSYSYRRNIRTRVCPWTWGAADGPDPALKHRIDKCVRQP